MTGKLPKRPNKVRTAVSLLYVSFAMLALYFLIAPSELLKADMFPEKDVAAIMLYTIYLGVFATIVGSTLAYMVWSGKNWARIFTLVTVVIVATPLLIINLYGGISGHFFTGMLEIVACVMQITSVIFLFQKPSSDWFAEIKLVKLKKQLGGEMAAE
jgi:hypothetical protein